jgi:hypothetical protein
MESLHRHRPYVNKDNEVVVVGFDDCFYRVAGAGRDVVFGWPLEEA